MFASLPEEVASARTVSWVGIVGRNCEREPGYRALRRGIDRTSGKEQVGK